MPGQRIARRLTRWAKPWDHHGVSVNMDRILRACGVTSEPRRIKMIAHAVVASGWKQNVWWFNAWGVKRGSWTGDYYTQDTIEEIDGVEQPFPSEPWRAFRNWRQAVEDYQRRINPSSSSTGYAQAGALLDDDSPGSCAAFWQAAKKGRYFTGTKFTPQMFASVCNRVRREIASASRSELDAPIDVDSGLELTPVPAGEKFRKMEGWIEMIEAIALIILGATALLAAVLTG